MNAHSSEPVFKTIVMGTPSSFDPAQFYGTESAYIFHNLFRGLYRLDDKKGVLLEGAKSCNWITTKKLKCELNSQVKWSDGTSVQAQDYERAFRYLIDPTTKSREVFPLLKLKNAKKILNGEKKPQELGVKAEGSYTLQFDFDEPDLEFIEKLTAPIMVPWKVKPDVHSADKIISNGPYVVESFLPDQKMILKPNPHYPLGNPKRPNVEFIFINEDSTAQNLFDSKQINLQPRVDVALIPDRIGKPEFFQKVFSRFDYVGFGPEFLADKNLRKAVALALDYEELGKLLHAAGRPGCVGLSDYYINKRPCYDFNLAEAKKAFALVPQPFKDKTYTFKFSRAGGDNILKVVQWYQNQLQKNLGLKVNIESTEQGMYLQTLRTQTPDLFRKGINLDRPTCTSALEGFKSDSPDNYSKYNSAKFDKDLEELEKIANPNSKKQKCTQMVQDLMDDYVMIPQGLIHYSMLQDLKFKGWKFNELNQLDLSELMVISPDPIRESFSKEKKN